MNSIPDLNTFKTFGLYFANTDTINKPAGINNNDGFVIIIGSKASTFSQIYICMNPVYGALIRNTLDGGSTWRGWYKFASTLI